MDCVHLSAVMFKIILNTRASYPCGNATSVKSPFSSLSWGIWVIMISTTKERRPGI
jgi:hypothetical protein